MRSNRALADREPGVGRFYGFISALAPLEKYL